MIVAAEPKKDEPKRFVICDPYNGGCGIGFSIPASEFNLAAGHTCPSCQLKQNKLKLLRSQLIMARQFGHTDHTEIGCDLCAIQNQIDDLRTGGYDWREDYERRLRGILEDVSE